MTTAAQNIETIRAAFGNLKSMDPDGPIYAKLCAILDASDDEALMACYAARIAFVSPLALNRMLRRGIKIAA